MFKVFTAIWVIVMLIIIIWGAFTVAARSPLHLLWYIPAAIVWTAWIMAEAEKRY